VIVTKVVTQFKNLNFNSRYRHESAPNVKVLAARLGTKGWVGNPGELATVRERE
jgi:hypothetical protein